MLTSFPLAACSWVLIITTSSVTSLYAARFLQGMAMGVVFTVCPMYLAEIAEPRIRGALCGNFQTFWSLGILYAYATGPFLSYVSYAYANAAIAFVFGAAFVWAPESPYFLMMRNQTSRARDILVYLRDTNDVDDEMQSIKNSLKCNGDSAKWKDLVATKKDRRTLLVVMSVAFVKYMSGVAAVTTYITETLSRSTGGVLDNHTITIATGVVMLLATLISAYVADAIGRKPLIMLSTIGCIVFNAIAGIYFLLVNMKVTDIGSYSWVAYGSIGIYCVINNLGLSPLLQTLQAECFPSETRGLAGGLVSWVGTVLIFISLKQYQPVEQWTGVYMNYFLFSIYSLVGSIAIFAFMKETARKSLTQIQETDEKLLKKQPVHP